jgi:glycerol-3-phosphate dehydrogenase
MRQQKCDLLVIGGGINGVGIARDAVGRGLSVILCEKDDLAAHTSSASSKLIHGGLRYLEYYEFGLVRKALLERETLLRLAPHLISPLSFVMPHVSDLRPYFMLRAGLFIYDQLAKRELLAGSQSVKFSKHISGPYLKQHLQRGFLYSDAWVDDARLVIVNALDAQERGAIILTHTRCDAVQSHDGRWRAQLSQNVQGALQSIEVNAACIVNATGAWAAQLQGLFVHREKPKQLRLIKGSHIIVKRLFTHEHAYIFQHSDGRIVFVIPYETEFSLIGTTDLEYQGGLENLTISPDEIEYLCNLCNVYFQQQISAADVLHSYAGVRPLVDDGRADAKSITRDYQLDFVDSPAPVLHVFGGKITTYRRLAEDALDIIAPYLPCKSAAWTKNACLPGGDILSPQPSNQNVRGFPLFIQQCCERYPWVAVSTVTRMARAYGTRIHHILGVCKDEQSMGEQVLPGLWACELNYLCIKEFARSAEDILWRRTKLGLHLSPDSAEVLNAWLAQHHPLLAPPSV